MNPGTRVLIRGTGGSESEKWMRQKQGSERREGAVDAGFSDGERGSGRRNSECSSLEAMYEVTSGASQKEPSPGELGFQTSETCPSEPKIIN